MQRFYGGDPMQWARMPSGWVNAYMAMLPRLQNEETLREIVAVGTGAGPMQPQARQNVIRSLSRKEPQPRRSLDELRAMGVNVREV